VGKASEDVEMKEDGSTAPTTGAESSTEDTTVSLSASTFAAKREREKKLIEPTFEILQNFSRVTPSQLAHIAFPREN
jgi:26S proteasome regulatory subunit RPN2 C-terminal domain